MEKLKQTIQRQLTFFLELSGGTLITSVFLAVWVVVQYGFNQLVQWLGLTGLDQNFLWVFQIIFGVTTLLPILIFYLEEIIIAVIRSYQRIMQVINEVIENENP